MPYATLAGRALHYRCDGPGDYPCLLLANSIAADLTMWEAATDTLAKRFRVVRYDMPGHGRSEPLPDLDTLGALARAPQAVLDAEGIERAHLAGISLGAMVLAEFALQSPGRAMSLIYCNAIVTAPLAYAAFWTERIEQVTSSGMASIVAPTLDRWFTPDARPELREAAARMIGQTSLQGFVAAATALTRLDVGRRLASLDIPKLFIAGEMDQAAPPQVMSEAAGNAGAAFQQLPRTAHLSSLERPEALAALIGDFTGSIAPLPGM